MREAGRHVDVFCETVESQNSCNAVRRLYKNMTDTHHVRRIKLFKDTKTEKFFKLLLSQNDESKRHIKCYQGKFEETRLRNEQIVNTEI